MTNSFLFDTLQKIIRERKRRGLTISVLARQVRIRYQYLQDLELSNCDDLTLSQVRQIEKLANFLKIETDKKQWTKIYFEYKNNQILDFRLDQNQSDKPRKNVFTIFTSNNFNIVLVLIMIFGVLFLVGLPAYLVVRPAEVFWDEKIENNTIEISNTRKQVTGRTERAKLMVFGGEEILIRDGKFSLTLPKPDREVVVNLVLTNYFNLTTKYQITIRPKT